MKSLNWKTPLLVILIFGVLFPKIKGSTESASEEIQRAKRKLVEAQDLVRHRQDYEKWREELEARGESVWGSSEIGDFLAELEAVSKKTGVSILNLKPYTFERSPSKNSIGAALEIEEEMKSVGKFLYEILRLPGAIAIERLSISEPIGASHRLSVELVVSRKTP